MAAWRDAQAWVPGYGHRYRRWVLDSLKFVDVQDLATGGDHVQELGDVYVDVALVGRARDEVSGDLLGGDGTPGDGAARHSLSELLERRPPALLALVGQPGSGKSTLLAYAARRGAQLAAPGRRGRRRVPVLLALRDRAASIVANPVISLPAVVRDAVGDGPGREPGGWWERQLHRGRCLILLDGLDEVAGADDRLAVAGWVERQIAAYPGNYFVVASRPYGLPGALAAQADVFVIRPFTADQVQLFLNRWYVAAERHATGASGWSARRAVRLRGRESAARLNSVLRQHPALHDLAVNPLLLTMIATAHRYRGALPDSRAELYGEICQVLLSRRVQAKDLPELLSWPARQTLLATVAYQLMRERATAFSADRVLEILRPQLARFSLSVTGQAFLDDIARNGLLVEAPAGRYSFAHLTFQEYLAARHVSANPGLRGSLTDNVSDPWWHETILLYAATADASPIVRACLDSGTIPALTLAFDCAEASTEIDPDLRVRLDRERRLAFAPDCSTEHRRLIAGVLAARLLRQTFTTAKGTRICTRPVPADLYWLFLADTKAPRPDRPCEPRADEPAIGMWGTEARAFVAWLNSITATATGTEVRLASHAELQADAIADAGAFDDTIDGAGDPSRQLPASVTAAWTQGYPELWVRRGVADPHELTGAALGQVVAVDAKTTAILPQVLTAAVLGVALDISRDLADIRALASALAGDLTVRANSGGKVVDLMHAHVHAIVLSYTHALELAQADAVTRTCATAPELVAALDLTPARALADAIARDLAGAIDLARIRAVELAAAIDLDLKVLSAFDFDLPHVVELANDHVTSLDRAYSLACSVPLTADPDLARVFGLAGFDTLDPALPVPGILGLPLRWVADGPLASTLLQVLAGMAPADPGGRSPSADPCLAFARALLARAGVQEATRLRAALGSSLADVLRALTAAESAKSAESAGSPDRNRLVGLNRLTDACAPMGGAHQVPEPGEAAALRAVALALAEGGAASGPEAAGVLRSVAATVTVVEDRSKGTAAAGESIVLALV